MKCIKKGLKRPSLVNYTSYYSKLRSVEVLTRSVNQVLNIIFIRGQIV